MSANISAQAGSAQITLFEIFSNYNNGSINVENSNPILHYYESILDNTIRATVTLTDTGHRNNSSQGSIFESNDLNLNVGEFVNFKVYDINGNQLSFVDKNKLRVSITRNIQENVNKAIFTLDMTSVEYFENPKLKCAVDKRYDGKIDQSVRSILTECIKTEKFIDVDPTLNNLNFRGLNQTPFHLCTWLASSSIPDLPNANQNLAGYFFYETADGYKFKSIDKLLSQRPKRTLIYNEIMDNIPPMYDGKILSYSFDQVSNLKTLMQTGAFGSSQIRTFDLSPGNLYDENNFNYKNQFINQTNIAGIEPIKYGLDQDEVTKRFFSITDKGFMPTGDTKQQLEKKNDINYDVNAIIRQSMMRYNSLFSIKLSLVIAGDLSLRAGDLIHCDFPQVSGNDLKTTSYKKSGIYMITDLCHRITKDGCYTSMNLVRDSIGRKPVQRF